MALPNEDELLAELDKLEKSTIRKGGDALQNVPHDGGFATEGTNIQEKAKKMYKALRKSGFKRSEAKKLVAKAYGDESSSDGSSDASSPMEKAINDSDSMSDDDSSGDSESSDGMSSDESSDESSDSSSPMPMSKSTGAAQLANAAGGGAVTPSDSLRKAIVEEHPDAGAALDAVPILGQLIDSIDKLVHKGRGASKKDLGVLRKSIVQLRDTQGEFNGKLAKALSMIAQRVIDTETIVKKMASEPINTANRAPTMRKSDLQQPAFHNGETHQITGGNGDPNQVSPLAQVPYLQIQEALTDICMKGGAELMDITKFENSKGDLRQLPPKVVQQLEQRLCPAS